MRKSIYLVLVFAMITLSCNETKKTTGVAGINLANMETSVVPGNDFYQYATGGWSATHPLKPEYSRFGTFDELREKSQEQVRTLINELGKQANEQGSVAQKIGDLYAVAMDSDRLNADGAKPLLPYLEKVKALTDKSQLTAMLAGMFRDGFSPFFRFSVDADDRNSSMNIMHLAQGGTKMGDRDYYLTDDNRSKDLRVKYVALIENLFALSGYTPQEAKDASTAVMKIETQLAKVASSRVALRDPNANYHKMTLAELNKLSPDIAWGAFFDQAGAKGLKELDVRQLDPISEVGKIVKQYPIQDIRYYLCWNVISASASFLSDDFSKTQFEYYGRAISGTEAQQERWKRALNAIDRGLGEAVGQLYVEKYFPPTAKEKMMNLVQNLQTALGERIKNLSWMSAETKAKALDKLGAFTVKIGYPDKWRDYSNLNIDKKDSYWANIVRSNNFEYDYEISKFNQPVDKSEWLMRPQTVNAYYNPSTNEICFPAAILQPPFFNPDADDAVNYGAIGVVIGHEMTHGFDDEGRKFDKAGNLSEWWTADDAARFDGRAKVLVDDFDRIVVLDTIHADGHLTLGENIADQGGLQVSWQAYQNTLKGKPAPAPIDGLTHAQRFFIAYATVWAGNIRDAEILQRTKTDPHSLGRWRVNGALPHIDAWYEAFNVKPENTMYVPKEQRVAIW